MRKNETNDKNKAQYEQLWLRYFNDSLLEKGIITKEEHQKMNTRIVNRKGRVTPSLYYDYKRRNRHETDLAGPCLLCSGAGWI